MNFRQSSVDFFSAPTHQDQQMMFFVSAAIKYEYIFLRQFLKAYPNNIYYF
jgi:hypothetical protein